VTTSPLSVYSTTRDFVYVSLAESTSSLVVTGAHSRLRIPFWSTAYVDAAGTELSMQPAAARKTRIRAGRMMRERTVST
jgi:hypothetical protein